MSLLHTARLPLLFALIAALSPLAADGNPPFLPGDRWAVVGDSITECGSYHELVYLYYLTRYPALDFNLFNCGICGDSSVEVNSRYAWDIAPKNATVASVMLGMNDVHLDLYGEGSASRAEQRADADNAYVKNMEELLGRLKASGARIILITPSIYDQTVKSPAPDAMGANDALGRYAEKCGELAKKFSAQLIDLNAPMQEINARFQKGAPAFSLNGDDRIHPTDEGHFVMAMIFFKAVDATPWVSQTVIDAGDGKVLTHRNCEISNPQFASARMSFDSVEGSLPFPVVDSVKGIAEKLGFNGQFNRELLQVANLKPGTWRLEIDGVGIGKFNEKELAAGVNLADYPGTPQYAQALKVAGIEQSRHEAARDLRVLARARQMLETNGDTAAEGGDVALEIEKLAKAASKSDQEFMMWTVSQYRSIKPQEAGIQQKLEALGRQARLAAQPVSHHFLLLADTGSAGTSQPGAGKTAVNKSE